MLTAEVARPEDGGGDVAYPFSKMNIWFEDFELKMPERVGSNQAANLLLDDEGASESNKLYPYECRLRSLTYSAPLYATIARKFDNEPEEKVTICLG
jgi:DNA-directed RNA polymerase beta subunit